MRKLLISAFLAGVSWHENKSNWAGTAAAHEAAVEHSDESLIVDETLSRVDFEEMAAIAYPGALALGRHPVHGTYKNSNLEKRWRGWLACEQFRAGIKPTPRGE